MDPNKPSQPSNHLVLLKVQNKQGFVFNEKVKSITSFNEKGVFDVLSQHENFISIIKDKIIIHQLNGQDKEIKVDNAVLKVFKDEVHVFLGITPVENNS